LWSVRSWLLERRAARERLAYGQPQLDAQSARAAALVAIVKSTEQGRADRAHGCLSPPDADTRGPWKDREVHRGRRTCCPACGAHEGRHQRGHPDQRSDERRKELVLAERGLAHAAMVQVLPKGSLKAA
jgi:hypothetical protein